MSKVNNRPPKDEPWFWMSKGLLLSTAWRTLGINARRAVEFMVAEHMGHAGQNNGNIKAPHRQLAEFGIAERFIAAAIREAEEHGVIDCFRGGVRVATRYALTWLPLQDGTPPSNRWREYAPAPVPKKQKSAVQREGGAAVQREGRSPKSASHMYGRSAQNAAVQREGPLKRSSYQGGDDTQTYQAGVADVAAWSAPALRELRGTDCDEVLAWVRSLSLSPPLNDSRFFCAGPQPAAQARHGERITAI